MRIILTTLLLAASLFLKAQPVPAWQNNYPAGFATLSIDDLVADTANDAYAAFHSAPVMSYYGDLLLVKYANSGMMLWQDTLPDGYRNALLAVLPDNSLLIGGTAANLNGSLVFTRYAPNGNVIWSTPFDFFPSPFNEKLVAITTDAAGSCYVLATADSIYKQRTQVFKLDSSGNLLWHDVVSYNGDQAQGVAVKASSTGEAYVLLNRPDTLTNITDNMLLKYNSSGQRIAQTVLLNPSGGNFRFLELSGDSVVVAGGDVRQGSNTYMDFMLARFDTACNLLTHTIADIDSALGIPGSDSSSLPMGMLVHSSGAILIGGHFWNNTLGDSIGMICFQPNGAISWIKIFGGRGYFHELREDAGGYVYAGAYHRSSFNVYMSLFKLDIAGQELWHSDVGPGLMGLPLMDVAPNDDVFMTAALGPIALYATTVKFDFNTGINSAAVSPQQFILWPNPATETIMINNAAQRRFDFQLYNTAGQIVRSELQVQPGTSISLAGVATGMYFYVLRMGDGQVVSGKLVKE